MGVVSWIANEVLFNVLVTIFISKDVLHFLMRNFALFLEKSCTVSGTVSLLEKSCAISGEVLHYL